MTERVAIPTHHFVGRDGELAALATAFKRRGGAMVPIYGRRRVGKSELILHFLRNKRGVYHVGKSAPAALQIREFLEQAARALDEPLLSRLEATDWRSALTAVLDRAERGKRCVLAFDEFQWTVEASPELPSVLQELWDRRLQRGSVVLLLCGSFIGFMEREVLGKKSPLFGRRTGQIQVAPFGYRDAARFHRRFSVVDRARAYGILGGIPTYLQTFDDERSIEQNIADHLLTEFAPLYREPEFLLREELRDVANYQGVLFAIASGKGTTKEIATVTGLPERSLHYYLEQLVQLGYVARRHPLTSGRPNARIVRFVVDDPLLRFWFRFVFPNASEIQRLGPRAALRTLIAPQLDMYMGSCFERLCREALPQIYEAEGVSGAFRIGEYWDKSTQIDVVGVRDDGVIDLGECKWGPVSSAPSLAAELARKVSAYPNPKNATLARRLFVRDTPKSRRLGDARLHSLASLY